MNTAEQYGMVALSDVSLGYGSPQIPLFLQSLAVHYNTRAFVIEPDEPNRPAVRLNGYDNLHIRRMSSAQPFYTMSAHSERNAQAAAVANAGKSPILVFFSPAQLAVLSQLTYKPDLVIVYMLEIDSYAAMLNFHGNEIDHLILPEYQRLRHVLGSYRFNPAMRSSIIMNVVKRDPSIEIIPAAVREKAVMYAGTLSSRLTFADEFTRLPLKALPITICGNFVGDDADALQREIKNLDGAGGVRYKGYVPSKELRATLARHAFSLVRWNPAAGLNYHYACPNKFFEAIAFGVPPIAAPHPQCVEVINRYGCGILAKDFTDEAMADAIGRGLAMVGTDEYVRMVERCVLAYDHMLNWDAQFKKYTRGLPVIDQETAA